jgi:hypothetical protein
MQPPPAVLSRPQQHQPVSVCGGSNRHGSRSSSNSNMASTVPSHPPHIQELPCKLEPPPTCAARDSRSVLLVLSWLEALAAAACAAESSSCRLLTAVARDAFSACNTAGGKRQVCCQVATGALSKGAQRHCACVSRPPPSAAHSLTCSASTCLLRSSASSLQACTCDSS